MSSLTPELLRELVAEARLAPSVHNVQPTRWRLVADGRLALVDDTAVRAPVQRKAHAFQRRTMRDQDVVA
ncbi:hypothetical protein J6500_31410 [Bradyrhizobium sp. WSM 1704]|uniref:nitroreductase family protein n=1 Tax=Bradyrhizobium semiaridum TaxID=2821404 RepID=UPI001CE2E784|nr:nitroreductase family protein [Bradyrhizobium semiaridum]MCA6126361.1 hypothetical protein [Bradyrhizobium semiaridum]